ncbi:MAG: TolC family protein [Deltaproteobacteria bacterium]|nr:TolC family protein [Deltaproteobacteria bacterium]
MKHHFNALLLVLLSGCSVVTPQPGFNDVKGIVAGRIGEEVVWRAGTEEKPSSEESEIEASIDVILADELTLPEALKIALLNNRGMQAVYQELAIAEADLVRAGRISNPVLDGELRFPSGGGSAVIELALVQDFLDLLFLRSRVRIAESDFEAVKLRVALQVLRLAGDVRRTYYELLAAEQRVEMRQQVRTASKGAYELARSLRAAGNITALSLLNEKQLYERSKLDLRRAELEAAQKREELNQLLGVWGDRTLWASSSRLPDLPEARAYDEQLERLAVERSLELEARRRAIEGAAARLKISLPAALFSGSELGASAEREKGWGVGPSLSLPIPIFDLGGASAARAKAALRREIEMYTQHAVLLRSRARELQSAERVLWEQADYYKRVMLPLSSEIVQQTQLQYNAMQLSPFELLSAKQRQIETGERYIDALRDYWLVRSQIDQLAAGGEVAPSSGGSPAAEGKWETLRESVH